MLEVSLRYGSALFSLALEQNKVVQWQKEIKELISLIEENKDFLELLDSKFLSASERKDIADKTLLFDDEYLNSFIKVIIDNKRINIFLDILYAFNSLCNEHRDIIEGYLYSVTPLNKEQIQHIESALSKKEGKNVELRNLIDKSLIGGLKVVIEDRVYDDSIKYHLKEMKTTLMK